MRRIMPLFSVFLLCGMLVWSGIARAADTAINEQGAAGLKKQVEESLKWRADMAKSLGRGLVMGADIAVTPKGAFYEVKIPGLGVLFGPQGRLDIGTVVINAAPGQSGEWLLQNVTLPPVLTFYDSASAPTATVTIGSQRFSGDWWPDREMYSKIDSLCENIQIKSAGKDAVTATIGSLKTLVDLKDNGDSTWTGPADFTGTDIKIDVPGKNAVQLAIGKIVSHNTYHNLDVRPMLEIRKALQNVLKDGVPPAGDKDKQMALAGILLKTPIAMEGMSTALQVEGFSLHEKTAVAPQQPREVSFDKLFVAGTTTGLQAEKSAAVFGAGLSGLHVAPLPADMADLLPDTFNVEISLTNLPSKKMLEPLFAALQKSVAAGKAPAQDPAQGAIMQAVGAMPKMMQDAGATLTVQNTFIRSKDLDTSLEGKINAAAATTFGATGKMTLSVKGIDETTQKLQAMAVKPGADPQMMSYVGGLTVFQMMGQSDKAADGKALRNYVFELTPDGKILLNGSDLKLLTASLGKASIGAPVEAAPDSVPMSPIPPSSEPPAKQPQP